MKFLLCKLKPKGPFHIGEREAWLEGSETFIHSDTLFSALCNAWRLVYGKDKLESLLMKYQENSPPFLLSSAFPFWKDTPFFPVPLNLTPKEKKDKKIRFISFDLLKLLFREKRGENLSETGETIPDNKEEKPWTLENIPRVGLNRLNNHPGENFFHFGQVFYKKDAVLFFLIHFIDSLIEKELKAVIRLLSDEGIGGDRTCGKGFFEYPVFQDFEYQPPIDPDAYYMLSLFYPSSDDMNHISFKKSYYDLLERKGYIYSEGGKSLRRKSLRLFREGSIFPSKQNLQGKIADITPEAFKLHKVFRFGTAFTFPFKLEE